MHFRSPPKNSCYISEHSVLSWYRCFYYIHVSTKTSLPMDYLHLLPWRNMDAMSFLWWMLWNKKERITRGSGIKERVFIPGIELAFFKRTSANLSPITMTSIADTFLSGASELIALFRLLRRLLKLVICSSEILQKPVAWISLRLLNSFLMTEPFRVAGSRDVQLTLHWGYFVGKLVLGLAFLKHCFQSPRRTYPGDYWERMLVTLANESYFQLPSTSELPMAFLGQAVCCWIMAA